MRLFIILWAVLQSVVAIGQMSFYTVSGVVLDASDRHSLEGVRVFTHESNLQTFTDSVGVFHLVGMSTGMHHVHFEMVGYKAAAEYFAVESSDASGWIVLLEPSHIELKQVVIESEVSKAQYQAQSLDLIVLGKEELKGTPAQTLAQRLTTLPGVNQLQTGVGIGKPVIRGLSGNRIVVSDLGMKQEGQQWGSDHGLEIDPYNAERIEIIKGPATLLYGSDALGGVIRIQTPAVPQVGLSGEVGSYYRSNNDYLGSSMELNGAKGKWFAKIRTTWAEYGDTRIPADRFTYLNRTLPLYNERLKNTAGRDFHYQSTIGYTSDRMIIKATWSHFHQRNGLFPGIVGIPTGGSVADDGNTRNVDLPHQIVDHYKAALNMTYNLKKGWLQWDAGVQRNERQEMIRPHREGYAPLPDSPLAHHLTLTTWQTSIRYHAHRFGQWRFIPGVQAAIQSNKRGGWEFLLPNHQSMNAGAYLFAEHSSHNERVIWNGGIRYDFGQVKGEQFYTPIYSSDEQIQGYTERVGNVNKLFHQLSGGLGWSYSPNSRWNLKANAARSFRMPNPAELMINGIHHGTFRHEMGDSTLQSEIGYQFDFTALFQLHNAYLKLTPYFNYFDGYIYLRPTAQFSTLPDGGQVYQYTQHNAWFTGAELYLEWHPIESLHAEGGLDYVKSYNVNTGLALPFTPPARFRLKLSYETERSFGILEALTFGTMYLGWTDQRDTDRNELATSGAFTMDVFVKSTLRLGEQQIDVAVSASNLFDRYYLNHLSAYRQLNLPEQGRNINVSLHWPFQFEKRNKNI
jgi:iron complex outermembrane receptor protein